MNFKKSIKNGTFWISLYHHLSRRKYAVKEADNLIGLYNRIICYEKVRDKYMYCLDNHKPADPATQKYSNKIWTCWLQGIENAPEIVKKCNQTLIERFPDREVIVITAENFADYIEVPDWFLDKWKKGIIDNTKFSNLIRLELLIKYGGLWIDSTVYCSTSDVPDYIFDEPLFMYSENALGDIRCGATWLISACSNNNILRATRDAYLEYWKNENELIEYFVITFCIRMAVEKYPEEWQAMMTVPAKTEGILFKYLFEPYNEQIWKNIKELTPIHKLSFKEGADNYKIENTFYKALIDGKLD